ncbi:hypothetical protein IEQ34_022407 [Dendrobium chrysotoxum]|uniref:Uncharacterized protein n=1 Tax=Dendrobium chrysotoxum TaxID=161865 RepID=A0AAV7FYW3_DENCH|nr:hypothetical protein IEQ34_022407 [Dendrobium chrysotoxum]
MDTSKFGKEEEEEEEEEEWSSNGTGWTKYFRSDGSHIEEDDCGNGTVEDDDSLASDASSGPADLAHPCNRRSEDSEVKGHVKCMFDEEEEEGHERQEAEKNKLGKKESKKLKEKIKRRNVIKV